MPFVKILSTVQDHCATVTINRPEAMNAFDYQTPRELEHAFQDAANDDRVAMQALTGAGGTAQGETCLTI